MLCAAGSEAGSDEGASSGFCAVSGESVGAAAIVSSVISACASASNSGRSANTSGIARFSCVQPSFTTVTSTGSLFQLTHFSACLRFSSLMPSGTCTVSFGATFIISPIGEVVRSLPSKQMSARFRQLMMQFSPMLFTLSVKCRLVRF